MPITYPHFSDLASSRAGQAMLGGLLGCLLGALLSAKPAFAFLIVGAVLGVITVAAALVYPGRVFVVMVLAVALIPTYASPGVGPLLLMPGAALAWAIAGTLAWRNAIQRGHIFRPTAIDFAVIIFLGLMYVSLSFSQQVDTNTYLNILLAWGGPFLAARLLLQDTRRPAYVVAAAFALVTLIVAPVAALEAAGGSNPFLSLQFNGVESSIWAAPASRLGQIRAEASFGHAIALSMFASVSALLSLGMGIYSREAKRRYIWLGLAALAVGVQALTLSRTGWLIIIFGVALLAVTAALRVARQRLALVYALAGTLIVGMMVTGNAPKELELFPSNSAGAEGAAFQDSGAYREKLLERALEPGVLGLWGNPANRVTPAVSATNDATDNAYIILADEWGLIPTFALFAIVATLLIAIVLARARGEELVIAPIAALTSLLALFFVAFITQQQMMIWLLVGAASVAYERVAALRREPRPTQRLAPMPERW